MDEDDDDTQVYKDHGDALTIAYQSAMEKNHRRKTMGDDDDDTQVYKDHGDALTIAYQSGYYDGKKAAQRQRVDLTDADWKEIEDMPDVFDQGVAWCLARLKKRNA